MTVLSILIVNWNTKTFLRECLASIEEYPPTEHYEVIVVDNASNDGSKAMIKQEFRNVTLIESATNAGYAAANNLALDKSVGDWILLLNPDVRAVPNTFDKALAVARSLPDFGALGIKQIGADGKIQRSVRAFPNAINVLWEITYLSRLLPKSTTFGAYRMTWFDYSGTIEVDQPMATFLLTSRNVYTEVGALDEVFPIFFNDVDWCYRIKATGHKVYYTDQAEIMHYGGAGTGQAVRSSMAIESKRSFLKFYEKHYALMLPSIIYYTIRRLVMFSIKLGEKR